MSDAVIIAALGMIGAVLTVVLPLLIKVWFDLKTLNHAVNSRLDQLLESKGRENFSAGVKQGGDEERSNPTAPQVTQAAKEGVKEGIAEAGATIGAKVDAVAEKIIDAVKPKEGGCNDNIN